MTMPSSEVITGIVSTPLTRAITPSAEREAILQNSERHAGWSRSLVQQMNSRNDGFSYNMSYWQQAYIISRKGKQTKKAYAYHITVTKSWNKQETVYEDVFDSYSMDLNVFKGQLNARFSGTQ